jgi:lectin-like protein
MRRLYYALALSACGASLDNPSPVGGIDAPIVPPHFDAAADDIDATPFMPPIDAAIDAPPDARACAGGDAATTVSDGSCLVLFKQAKSFADAETACILFGSRLAVIDSKVRDDAAKALAGATDVFIGLSDRTTEGTFVWEDGSPLAFADFHVGEPNNGGGQFQEDCVVINGVRGGTWDDRPCAAGAPAVGVYPYLCQF